MPLFGPPNIEVLKRKRQVRRLIKALRYRPDGKVRLAAAEALREIKDARAIAPLAAVLKDPDRAVRLAAVRALGAMDDRRAVELLDTVLKDPDQGIRLAVVQALEETKQGGYAVQSLERAFEDEDQEVRLAAVQALGERKEKDAVERLARSARKSRRPDVCRAAVQALGANKEALDMKVYLYEAPGVREAVQGLPYVVRRSPPPDLHRDVQAMLKPGWDLKLSIQSSAARQDRYSKYEYWTVFEVVVAAAVQSGDKDVRLAAVAALGTMQAARAVEPLARVTRQSSDEDVRRAAAEALRATFAPMVSALQDQDLLARLAAVEALGMIQEACPSASPDWESIVRLAGSAAESACTDPNEQVRRAAAKALGALRAAGTVAPLVVMIHRYQGATEAEAVKALERILEQSASHCAPEDLQAVAVLTNFFYTINSSCLYEPRYEVDCAQIRQFARQELLRRGLEA